MDRDGIVAGRGPVVEIADDEGEALHDPRVADAGGDLLDVVELEEMELAVGAGTGIDLGEDTGDLGGDGEGGVVPVAAEVGADEVVVGQEFH